MSGGTGTREMLRMTRGSPRLWAMESTGRDRPSCGALTPGLGCSARLGTANGLQAERAAV